MRIAVVTPYFQEDRETLKRCIDSVMAQSVPVDHVLVADGHPQAWVETYDHVDHLVLCKSSADYGDTPRSLGFLLAMRRDYDIIQFLDADNILFEGHFENVLTGFATTGADLLIARRYMLRPDGSIINWKVEEDEKLRHVDTSCFVFSRNAFTVGLKWSHIPRELGFIDDRVFFACVRNSKLKIAVLPNKTVGYTCMWPGVYRAIGENPPLGHRKSLQDRYDNAKAWWSTLDENRRQLIQRNLGASIRLRR
jgi:glycosyltransferase involved in cell wall biosynthesis